MYLCVRRERSCISVLDVSGLVCAKREWTCICVLDVYFISIYFSLFSALSVVG